MMTNQFPHTTFPNTPFRTSAHAVQIDKEKPSLLRRFIPIMIGLGVFTVIGVSAYTASTGFVKKVAEVPAPKIVTVPRTLQSEASQDGSELMIEPSTSGVSDFGSALPPVQSPFYNPRPVHKRHVQAKASPDLAINVSVPATAVENVEASDPEIQSADEILRDDANSEDNATVEATQPTSAPVHNAKPQVTASYSMRDSHKIESATPSQDNAAKAVALPAPSASQTQESPLPVPEIEPASAQSAE